MGALKPYSCYKNVGLFWLNNIPEHWQTRKVKHLLAERVEKGYPEKPLLAATQTKGVVTKELYENRTVLAQKDLHLLKLVRVGDFVISLRSFQGGIEYAYYEGIISPAYTIMTPNINISKGYFRHLAKSKLFIELLKQCVTGIREGQNIDYSVLKNSLIPLPPKEEQDQIVRYLDSKLAKINKFIRNKKRLIELLKEQKQAVINQAVTKGLDPDAKMKPSGVEWLGDVPEGWVVVKVKHLLLSKKGALKVGPFGSDLKGNDITTDGEVMIFNQRTVIDKNFNTIENRVTLSTYIRLRSFEVFSDDLLITTRGTIGKTVIVPTLYYRAILHPCLMRLQIDQNKMNLSYIELLIGESTIFYEQLRILSNATTIEVIYSGNLKNIKLPIPTQQEQTEILSYIHKSISIIDQTIDRITKEIDLITEYRTSLISAVVTGKIDVRGIEVEEPPAEDLAALEPAELEAEELQEDDLLESEAG